MTAEDPVLRTLLLVLAAFLVVFLAIPVFMMVLMVPIMGPGRWGHISAEAGGWGGMVLTAIPLLVLVGLGYVLYVAASNGDSPQTDSALEELQAAYARGDLSDEQFERRRDRLQRD